VAELEHRFPRLDDSTTVLKANLEVSHSLRRKLADSMSNLFALAAPEPLSMLLSFVQTESGPLETDVKCAPTETLEEAFANMLGAPSQP